jgi:hypothetical protein
LRKWGRSAGTYYVTTLEDQQQPNAPRDRSPFKLTEKELVEGGGFIREVDDAIKLDRVNDKVDALVSAVDRYGTRVDRIEEKFDTRLANLTDKASDNNSEFERTVAEMRLDVTRLEAQVKVLLDLRESSWVQGALLLLNDKTVRGVLLVLGAWIASMIGPGVLKALLKLIGGG